jgi:ABC-2 type transport system permease protein
MRFLSLASRNMKEIYRDPISVGLGLGLPAIFLLLFSSIGKKAPIEVFTVKMLTPAIIVFGFGFLIMFSAILLAKDRQSAFLARLMTTPLKSSDFIMAYILPLIPISLAQIIVGYIVGIILGLKLDISIFIVLVILITAALGCIGLGLTLGSLFTQNQVSGIGSITIVMISLFSGAWMDLKMVGGVFEFIGNILPFSHAINAARNISRGLSFSGIIIDYFWVLGYTLVFLVSGILAFKWKTKR